jgi:hypothetical protein
MRSTRRIGGLTPRWLTPFRQAAGTHGVAGVDGTGAVAFDATTRDAASPDVDARDRDQIDSKDQGT